MAEIIYGPECWWHAHHDRVMAKGKSKNSKKLKALFLASLYRERAKFYVAMTSEARADAVAKMLAGDVIEDGLYYGA